MDIKKLKSGESITKKIEVTFEREGEDLGVKLRGNLTGEEIGIVVAILMAEED